MSNSRAKRPVSPVLSMTGLSEPRRVRNVAKDGKSITRIALVLAGKLAHPSQHCIRIGVRCHGDRGAFGLSAARLARNAH
jgi:hypothetical protein